MSFQLRLTIPGKSGSLDVARNNLPHFPPIISGPKPRNPISNALLSLKCANSFYARWKGSEIHVGGRMRNSKEGKISEGPQLHGVKANKNWRRRAMINGFLRSLPRNQRRLTGRRKARSQGSPMSDSFFLRFSFLSLFLLVNVETRGGRVYSYKRRRGRGSMDVTGRFPLSLHLSFCVSNKPTMDRGARDSDARKSAWKYQPNGRILSSYADRVTARGRKWGVKKESAWGKKMTRKWGERLRPFGTNSSSSVFRFPLVSFQSSFASSPSSLRHFPLNSSITSLLHPLYLRHLPTSWPIK